MLVLDLAWNYGSRSRQIHVEIDHPMANVENRIRTVTYLASSDPGLRVMLNHMLGADYHVAVHEMVGGGVSVRLTRRLVKAVDTLWTAGDDPSAQPLPAISSGDHPLAEREFTKDVSVSRQIVRIFHGRVKPGREAEWEDLMDEQLAMETMSPPHGFLRAFRGKPIDGDSHDFMFISIWRDWDSVRSYAGASAGPVLFRNQVDLSDVISVEHYELV